MARTGRNSAVIPLGFVSRNRRALMTSTALQSAVILVLALPCHAQPLPNARPTGGAVVAGSAAISQTNTNTRIDQASQRAAIDWKSFDVGSQQSVTFRQPSTNSVALNRVTGPDPSQIAGRIDANGQIILVNQSGVNFYKGAQVNAAGVMVSAANISNQNFMAGVTKFDQPGNPNARIDNQGSITVRQAGLAALVAPQVANSGVISAHLGHVVLAGAKTATLDLYGDGLLSLDVSNQVAQAPVGKDDKVATALVTNTGTIIADGGTVQLTARAADGIVQNLVQAGGTIRTATIGDHTGVVALNGVGGSIVVEGQLSAPGNAPGTKGGAIEVVADGNVSVASAARINASGKAGGGTVAVGGTLARARDQKAVSAVVAANTVIQKGAVVSADAITNGDGGRVAVLSSRATDMAATITAKGAPQGGKGGFVEVSGDTGFALTGSIDVSAVKGAAGSILLDPQDLFISAINPDNGAEHIEPVGTGVPADGLPDSSHNSWLTPDSINRLSGAVTIATTRDLSVLSPMDTTTSAITNLTLSAGRDLVVNANAAIITAGSILLSAGDLVPTGQLTLSSPIASLNGSIFLHAHAGDITQDAAVTANGTNQLVSFRTDGTTFFGAPVQASRGTIEFGPTTDNTFLVDGGFNHDFVALTYRIGQTTEPFTSNPGPKASTVNFGDVGVSGETYSLKDVATIDVQAYGAVSQTASSIVNLGDTGLTLTGSGGPVDLGAAGNTFTRLGNFTANGSFILASKNALEIAGSLDVASGTAELRINGALTEKGGIITAGTLTGNGVAVTLNGANNIANLGSFTATGGLSLTDASALNISGPVTAGAQPIALQTGGGLTEIGGTITAGTLTVNAAGTVSLLSRTNAITTIGASQVMGGDLTVVDGNDLTLFGALQANNLFVEVAKAGGTLTLGTPFIANETRLGVPATLTATGTGGRISLVADNYVVGNSDSSIATTAGTVELAPFSSINASLLGTGGLVIGNPLLSIIQTNGGTLDIGGFTDVPAGALTPAASASSVTVGPADLTGIASTLRLDSRGPITETNGPLVVTNLTGSAGTSAEFTSANQVAALGNFTAGSFELNNGADLLIAGTLNAAHIELRALSNQISLGDGASLITGGTTRPSGPFDPALAPSNPTAPGALIQAANFTQIGSSTVLGQGGSPATLQIVTTGHAQFDPPAGLQATNTWLILDLASGTAAGNVSVNALDVIYTTPGSANLSGSIAGITGGAAAAAGFIQPAINVNYLFNGCDIGGTVCQLQQALNIGLTATLGAILPLVAVAPPSLTDPPRMAMIALPLLSVPPPQLTDPDVVPPNITYLDY